MIILWFYFTFFLFTWYSSKLLKNTQYLDQYFHIPQLIFLIAVYLLPYFYSYELNYLLILASFGLQFPFLFNTGLNFYRKLSLNHIGKYDFLKFWQTVVLFVLGVLVLLYRFRII
jgi:hypothetical protein